MFRRRTVTEDPPSAEQSGKVGGKGRPTPKRSEAEKRRRQPITAPKNRKEAYRKVRQDQAKNRVKAKQGMARGDDRYLPKRDQGPARRLVRDYVDSRRTFAEFFMYITLLVLVASMVLAPALKGPAMSLVYPVLLVLIVGESLMLARRIRKLVNERLPGESTKGLGFYAATRAMQIRRFRMPQPQLKPGQQDQV